MATTVTNAAFAALAAAVPAPFGPLTRVGSLESTPRKLPNSDTEIEVTGQGSVTFYISYDQLNNADVRDRKIANAYPVGSLVKKLQDFLGVMNVMADRLDPVDATPQEYHETFQLFKYFPAIIGLTPVFNFSEMNRDNVVKASFTGSGTAAVRTVVNTTTGYGLEDAVWDWDWGDGTAHSTVEDPPPHTYADDGTYTVTLRVASRGGFSSFSQTTVMNVP